jgi:SAM-dependent methyltransferase
MVSTYNSRATSSPSSSAVRAVVGDLFDKSDPFPAALSDAEWTDFDIATVGFGFHHFEDVVYSAKQLLGRLRPGGVLVINDFLEGGDLRADEEGRPIAGSEGNHAVHTHGHKHGHDHKHGDDGGHKHDHGHHHHGHGKDEKHDVSDSSREFKKKMNDSIVVPHFTIEGVREFFTEAGFVDVDVITLDERSYMEFAGMKVWRTILIARGRRPEEKSEL